MTSKGIRKGSAVQEGGRTIPNELLWLICVVVDLGMAVALFRLFGRVGLYGLVVMDVIVCNIQVVKLVPLFGFTATLGNILYASIFFATDVLSEIYGPREARKAVWLGLGAFVAATVAMQLALLFKPTPEDTVQDAMTALFSLMPRVAAASMAAYVISQLHDVWAFHMWRRKTGGRMLWLRNNLSTMVSQLIDSVVFCAIAFAGMYSFTIWLQILVTTYVLKWLVAVLDTPFIYLAVRMRPAEAA